MTEGRRLRPAVLVAVAVALVVALGLALLLMGVPPACVVLSVGAALGTALTGGLLSQLLRGRSMLLQILLAVLTTVAAIVVGVLVTARAVFISDHDLAMLGPVLLLSGVVAVCTAFLLFAPFERSVDAVARMTWRLTVAPGRVSVPAGIATSELRMLASEIAVVGEQLEHAQRRARRLEESRQELVTSISHDLRSPIASIRAMAEALEDGVVADETTTAAYHRALRQESHRLGRLVDDLFELARISSGTLDQNQELAPLGEVVTEAVDRSAPRGAGCGVRVVLVADTAPQDLVAASDLRRVLDNLLDNAIRHTPPGGEVVVGIAADPGAVAVAVTDGCGGIPDRDLPHVFDVAFRGDEARTRDSAGGGLGLAIARGLVEARGGRIDVVNVAGGCRFTVRLERAPVRPATSPVWSTLA